MDRQKKQRAWIQFSELAERYGRNIGTAEGYEQLKRAVIDGKFERKGRSRVFYLHPGVTATKMTREKMRNAVETFPAETVRRQYLACCWMPREVADAWCQSWGIEPAELALADGQAVKSRRAAAEADAHSARVEAAETRLNSVNEGIKAAKAEADAATNEFVTTQEKGDWRKAAEAQRKRGRHECDDADAIDEMLRLIQCEGYSSVRQAAGSAVASGLARGNSTKSTIDRLRKKFTRRFPGIKP